MSSRLHSTVRLLLLVFYGIYALSPIYASASASCSDHCRDERRHPHEYSVGIVWVNVLLSSLADDEIGGRDTAGGTSLSKDDTDLVLIKKKRAVLREQQVATPPTFATFMLQDASPDSALPVYQASEDPLDLTHRQSDGYSTLHAGLSPPLHLS